MTPYRVCWGHQEVEGTKLLVGYLCPLVLANAGSEVHEELKAWPYYIRRTGPVTTTDDSVAATLTYFVLKIA